MEVEEMEVHWTSGGSEPAVAANQRHSEPTAAANRWR